MGFFDFFKCKKCKNDVAKAGHTDTIKPVVRPVEQLNPVNDNSDSRFTPNFVNALEENEVFVFGSNLEGFHGGGAARIAFKRFGAKWGKGVGHYGQSYAIPTMQGGVDTVRPYVDQFTEYAKEHSELTFLVTRIGCGIAGFRDEDIAPLFKEAAKLPNVKIPKSFAAVLDKESSDDKPSENE